MHGTLEVLQQRGGSSLTPGEGGGPGGVHVSGQSMERLLAGSEYKNSSGCSMQVKTMTRQLTC